MLEERSQQDLVTSCVSNRLGNRFPEVQDIVGNEVGQVGVLRVVPNLFVGIKFRRIGGQPFHMDTSAKSFLESVCTRTMYGPTIHNQDDRPADPLQQASDKHFKIVRDDVVIKDVKIEAQPFALWRDGKG